MQYFVDCCQDLKHRKAKTIGVRDISATQRLCNTATSHTVRSTARWWTASSPIRKMLLRHHYCTHSMLRLPSAMLLLSLGGDGDNHLGLVYAISRFEVLLAATVAIPPWPFASVKKFGRACRCRVRTTDR